MLYQKRPVPVDAEQFSDPANPPRGVMRGTGQYGIPFFVMTVPAGRAVEVKPGDWIVATANPEHFERVSESEFHRLYEIPSVVEGTGYYCDGRLIYIERLHTDARGKPEGQWTSGVVQITPAAVSNIPA